LETLGALAACGTEGLARVPRFGRVMRQQLEASLDRFVSQLADSHDTSTSQIDPPSAEHVSDLRARGLAESRVSDIPHLGGQTSQAMAKLGARDREVLLCRLGYNAQPITLDEVGRLLGVTRERARQLESRALRKFVEAVPLLRDTGPRLTRLLSKRTEPLYLDLLPLEDRLFEGFEHRESFLGHLIERFSDPPLHVWPLHGRLIVTKISEEHWPVLRRRSESVLEEHAGSNLTRGDVELLLAAIASSNQAEDLTRELLNILEPLMYFAQTTEAEGPVLVGFGRGVRTAITAILENSPTPLTCREIMSQLTSRDIFPSDENACRNAIRASGAEVLSGRRYGLQKHLGLSEEELREVATVAQEVVLEGRARRQWHCSDLLREVLRRKPSWRRRGVDLYILNVALQYAQSLQPLGRFVWREGEGTETRSEDRRHVADLCVAMLEEAGGPLTTQELEERVERIRTVHHQFQPQPNERMARLSVGLWGLVDRDFGLSAVARSKLLDALARCLRRRRNPLHVSEIPAALARVIRPSRKVPSAHAILGLAQIDNRFRVTRGYMIKLDKRAHAGR
jgi:hypothetical protein